MSYQPPMRQTWTRSKLPDCSQLRECSLFGKGRRFPEKDSYLLAVQWQDLSQDNDMQLDRIRFYRKFGDDQKETEERDCELLRFCCCGQEGGYNKYPMREKGRTSSTRSHANWENRGGAQMDDGKNKLFLDERTMETEVRLGRKKVA